MGGSGTGDPANSLPRPPKEEGMGSRKVSSTICFLLLALVVWALPASSAEKPVVYFGINLRYTPRMLYHRYQPLMDYLSSNTPYRFELKISQDYAEALKDLKEGRTLISSLGDGAFIDAIVRDGARPIVKPLNAEGKPLYRSAIVVPGNSTIKSLVQLKGKRLAFGSSHSLSGNLLPRYMLRGAGVRMQDLASLTNLRNHDAVTKVVLKGQYDAGAVKDMFATKYRRYGLRVLAYSAPVPSVPLVVRRDAPKELRKAVAEALLKLDAHNPVHKKILADWDDEYIYGFVSASADDYREVIRMYRTKPFGCGTRCH